MTSHYIIDPSDLERRRLRAFEALHDPATTRLLTAIGVGRGWRCLEVGAGAGSVAVLLHKLVGHDGSVVATDIDTRYLGGCRTLGIEVRRHDLTAGDLQIGRFDLVHARAVLEHLADPSATIARLLLCVAPGGWLLVESHDLAPATLAAMPHHASTPEAGTAVIKFLEAATHLMESAGAHPELGPRLPRMLIDAGLSDVRSELRVTMHQADPNTLYPLSLRTLEQRLRSGGLFQDDEYQALVMATSDPAVRLPGPPLVAAWGRRQGTPERARQTRAAAGVSVMNTRPHTAFRQAHSGEGVSLMPETTAASPLNAPDVAVPFPLRVNPHLAAARERDLAWAKGAGLVSTPADERRYRSWDLALLVAGWVPDAPPDGLDVAINAFNWCTVYDDLHAGEKSTDPRHAHSIGGPILAYLETGDLPDNPTPVLLALHDVLTREKQRIPAENRLS